MHEDKIKCFEASMENQASDHKIDSLSVLHLEDDEDDVMLMTMYKIYFTVTIMHSFQINSHSLHAFCLILSQCNGINWISI